MADRKPGFFRVTIPRFPVRQNYSPADRVAMHRKHFQRTFIRRSRNHKPNIVRRAFQSNYTPSTVTIDTWKRIAAIRQGNVKRKRLLEILPRQERNRIYGSIKRYLVGSSRSSVNRNYLEREREREREGERQEKEVCARVDIFIPLMLWSEFSTFEWLPFFNRARFAANV